MLCFICLYMFSSLCLYIVSDDGNKDDQSIIQSCFFPDQPVSPEIHGLQSTFTVGQQPEVTCHVDYFWTESVSFSWSIDDIELPARTEEPVHHANNIATFSSTLLYNFDRSDELKNIVCSATVDKKSASDMVPIDMQCKATNITSGPTKWPSFEPSLGYTMAWGKIGDAP